MKKLRIAMSVLLLIAIAAGAWVVFFHSEWIKPGPPPEEAEPVTDVAVRTVKIGRATLHRYVECYGTINPALHRTGDKLPSSSARIAAPVPGVVSELFCAIGQRAEKGAPLFKLDDRLARSEEAKLEAALFSARASYAKLKASIRPEQIAVAETAVTKARQSVDYNIDADKRQKALAADQLASEKQLQDSALQLAATRADLIAAEKQLALLKNSPAPEEIAEAEARINEAERALAASQLSRSILTINAPLTGTVVKLNASPGESVDATSVVVELVDLNRLEMAASVPAVEAQLLKPGQAAEIRCAGARGAADGKSPLAPEIQDSSADTVYKGSVAAVGLQVDPKTDATTVYVALPPESGVRPGQAARLKIAVDEHRDCLVVPEECVFRDKVGITVIATVEDNNSSLQNVLVGLRENGLVEISGKEIKENDVVVTAGAYGLQVREESKVHVIDADSAGVEKSR